jgi:hypothetical protein
MTSRRSVVLARRSRTVHRGRFAAAAAGEMAFVRGDNQSATRYFGEYELGLDILAHRDPAHLAGEDPMPSGFELGPILGHRSILQRRIEYDSLLSVNLD